jgi:hypothetical protein
MKTNEMPASNAEKTKCSRWPYLLWVVLTIAAGLGSRRYAAALPSFIAEYAGDALWAAMIYFGIRFIFPARKTRYLVLLALAFSFSIETSQLYQADWINAIRSTPIGALVLGSGFLWSDLLCYMVGVGAAVSVDFVQKYISRRASKSLETR